MVNEHKDTAGPTAQQEAPAKVEARPLRHPWRWIFAAVLLILGLWFVIASARNEAFGWDTYFQYLFDRRIAIASLHTIAITILSMIIGVVGGAILAVMRMSPNPILRAISWIFLWIFRGTPIYVQLVFWGLLSAIYQSINLGFAEVSLQSVLTNAFFLAVMGLGLNEAAYMAEIVRSGISSVPEGQKEASKALGMSWWMTMRRTVLPQAMRIIIPPTGNEFISLLKTSSLVVAIPYTHEIFGRATDISAALFQPIPLLMVAASWYLVITSLLMVGQYFLERHFERGATRELTGRQLAALADAEGTIPRNVSVIQEGKN
ncbi:amino acid ABC transporter permease [Corynebacterium sp. ACRQM]|jgi:amino ABC transporter, permease protein, 3-TM region, his/glu/gln/arg/opine family|uniref:amino acid ABC transporter permease n=1 Tax=Corynebacterium TaxID=1716 RepID=UPI001EF591AE|nr:MULTISPECIES: amino acid ABC transporter permease [Corynebacterium]MCG7242036.1 amino acid ABC transporter permease [Corynebacterium sp. ACRPS]MCG7272612.1 amino acid ABC transporter permease [Corynebacterium sp. ACRQM]MCG7234879.1 amino acid ABC transporter permease [Corynebacterium sp. ACRPR]MDK8473120.1 amino acid ABC transporter permease [Corynebacterium sp. MSK078]MDK8814623.1 amino acid ABC transporter permease [Corynebacterium sp. MSK073]